MCQDHRYDGRFLKPPCSVPPLSLQTSKVEFTEIVALWPSFTTYQVRMKVNQASDTVLYLSEVRAGPGWSPCPAPQDDQGGLRIQTSIYKLPQGPPRAFTLECPQFHDKAIWTSNPFTSYRREWKDTPHIFVGILKGKICCLPHSRPRTHLYLLFCACNYLPQVTCGAVIYTVLVNLSLSLIIITLD